MPRERFCRRLFDRRGDASIDTFNSALLLKFKVKGLARFLSHAETLRMMHRVFIRAEIALVHSFGFNPHPRLSLALPRSVGVESDDELCIAEVREQIEQGDFCRLMRNLSNEMPGGFEITSAEITKAKKAFTSGAAEYLFSFGNGIDFSEIKNTAEKITNDEQFVINRYSPGKQAARQIDIKKFIKSIDVRNDTISVGCLFGPDGSVRIDELLQLFGLSQENLVLPIRRIKVDWNGN